MKSLNKVIVLFFFSSVLFATSIDTSGTINGNVTWSKSAADTFRIVGTINIGDGAVLTIEPGIVVYFTGDDYYFNITGTGRLLAIGNETDSILFTPEDKANKAWWGIRFSSMNGAADSSIIDHCIIEYAKADGSGMEEFGSGGGIYIQSCSKLRISNNLINNNEANNYGGAIYCYNFSYPLIINNTITNNNAMEGGAIKCQYYASPTIKNNMISNNQANMQGGAIHCDSQPLISNNIFTNNSADNGGAISCHISSAIITDNLISNNTTMSGGSAIYCNSSSITITNNTISNNYSEFRGGAIYITSSSPTLTNNVIINNTANFDGGAIWSYGSSLVMTNNTISNNRANRYGGGIFCTYDPDPIIKNTIFYGNTATNGSQIYLENDQCDPNFYYCDVQGGISAFGLGSGAYYTGTYFKNIDENPLFVSPSGGVGNGFDGVAANWRLQNSSLCLNAGNPDPTGLPTTDKDGNPRVSNCIVDIGAYEKFLTSIFKYGDLVGTETWSKSCIDTIKIIGTINIGNNDTLVIEPGLVVFFTGDNYYLNITGTGRLLAIGSETDSIRFTPADKVNNAWRGIRFSGMSADADSSVLDYCIIEYGEADGLEPFNAGGGIYVNGGYVNVFSKIRISNCMISNNKSNDNGAGVYIRYSNLDLSNNTIQNNMATTNGGGIYCLTSSPLITNNKISENKGIIGGGIFSYFSNPIIDNNNIYKNESNGEGGGIFSEGSSLLNIINNNICNNTANSSGGAISFLSVDTVNLINNVISNNYAVGNGGAIYSKSTFMNILNSSICNNDADNDIGGVFCYEFADANIRNSIIWGNTSNAGNTQVYFYEGSGTVTYCDIQGGSSSFKASSAFTINGLYSNNIDSDPLFVDPSDGAGTGYNGLIANWRLQVVSPCINMGDPDTTGLPSEDKDEVQRVLNCRVDIGAYEKLINSLFKTGDIVGYEIWSKSCIDTIKISGTINISNGDTLNIEPGIVVYFTGDNYYMNVTGTGRLLAIGSETDSITFTPHDKTNKTWWGIRFSSMDALADSSIIDYCIIEYASADGPAPYYHGGGIYIDGGSVTLFSKIRISNCRISNNSPTYYGGGIYCNYSSPLIIGNKIVDNYGWTGGGIYCNQSSSPSIYNNNINHNSSYNYGAGIFCDNSSSPLIKNNYICYNTTTHGFSYGAGIYCNHNSNPNIISNTISNNNSGYLAGAIYCYSSTSAIINNIISNNCSNIGGAIFYNNSSLTMTNNTITNNTATTSGGAICFQNSPDPVIKNTIFYGNTATNGSQIYLYDNISDPDFYYCDIQGDSSAFGKNTGVTYNGIYENNINSDPLFISPSGGSGTGFDGVLANWRLQDISPCINVGDKTVVGLPTTDIDGNPRVYGKNVDMGAYENQNVLGYIELKLKIFLQGAYR